MAKESMKARERKRARMTAQYADKRAKLKAEGNWAALDELPRNGSKVRMHNRCSLTGRPRGYMGLFGICRNQFRDLALNGHIPGVRKARW